VTVDLGGDERIAKDLGAGGLFVPGCELAIDEECDLVVRAGGEEHTIAARVVWRDESGAGMQLACDAETRVHLVELTAHEAAPAPTSVHDRLRGLTLVQQLKVAKTGELTERIALERIYGKNVWDALLHNPRLTGPEVARIARMGALPRVLVEVIVTNAAWLQMPEVRRALLTNPRLGQDQIARILRLLSKTELRVAAGAMVYSHAVRNAAKKLLRDD